MKKTGEILDWKRVAKAATIVGRENADNVEYDVYSQRDGL